MCSPGTFLIARPGFGESELCSSHALNLLREWSCVRKQQELGISATSESVARSISRQPRRWPAPSLPCHVSVCAMGSGLVPSRPRPELRILWTLSKVGRQSAARPVVTPRAVLRRRLHARSPKPPLGTLPSTGSFPSKKDTDVNGALAMNVTATGRRFPPRRQNTGAVAKPGRRAARLRFRLHTLLPPQSLGYRTARC